MVISKGKNVVDQDQVCSPSTLEHIENTPAPANTIEMHQQPQSSNGTTRAEVKSHEVLNINVEHPIAKEDPSLSVLPSSPLVQQIDYSNSSDHGKIDQDCSMVTKIDGVQNYARRPEGYELHKQNQFAMLEEVTTGQDEVAEIVASDLSLPPTKDVNNLNQVNLAHNTGPSSSHGTSGQSNKQKNKHGSSSGKKRHPFRRT